MLVTTFCDSEAVCVIPKRFQVIPWEYPFLLKTPCNIIVLYRYLQERFLLEYRVNFFVLLLKKLSLYFFSFYQVRI